MNFAKSILYHEEKATMYARIGKAKRAAAELLRADQLREVRRMKTEMLRARLKKSIELADEDNEFEQAYTTGEHSR
jgi:hypothetical protein